MEIGTVFLAQTRAMQAGADIVITVDDRTSLKVTLKARAGVYVVIESDGVPFEARAWHEGDGQTPTGLTPDASVSAWTVYGIVGHTR